MTVKKDAKGSSSKRDEGKRKAAKPSEGGGAVRSASAPGTETWLSSLMLSPRETEKLVVYQVAELARRRLGRGTKLNFPEAIALICEALMEAARDGKTVAEAIESGKQVLTRDDVMPEVPDMVTLVQVEATFKTGTQLVSVPHPIP
ncbi:urease subunit gamma [Streptomyces sp. NPDC093586]|uniref:urease subunit gamma n=1 Tax=Streptomyces sp. NPDC093586 TaxID=3366042 RepID=UPI0037F81487